MISENCCHVGVQEDGRPPSFLTPMPMLPSGLTFHSLFHGHPYEGGEVIGDDGCVGL